MRNRTPFIARVILGVFFFLSMAAATKVDAAPIGDSAKGKKLHETYCVECHDSKVYQRPNRRVNSLEDLIGQVKTCSRLPKDLLSPAQVNDIIVYLNDTYYHFK